MLREVKLYGHLGARFGRSFKLDVGTPAEAMAALRANLEGFEAYMFQHSKPGYHVLVEKRGLSEGELLQPCGRGTIKIIPAIAGAKSGMFQTIIGAVLVVVGTVYSMPFLTQAGIALAAGGVTAMLSAHPSALGRSNEKAENMPSYGFNGPVNTTTQGNPMPVCYGRMIVGSQVLSFGMSIEDSHSGYPVTPGGNNGIPAGQSVIAGVIRVVMNGGSNDHNNGWWHFDVILFLGGVTLSNGWAYDIEWTTGTNNVVTVHSAIFNAEISGFSFDATVYPQNTMPAPGTNAKISAAAGGGAPPTDVPADQPRPGDMYE